MFVDSRNSYVVGLVYRGSKRKSAGGLFLGSLIRCKIRKICQKHPSLTPL